MDILDFDYDTKHGFAHVIVSEKEAGDKWVVQCCLYQPEWNAGEESKPDYEEKIVQSDCGHDWGICGDVNKKAFDYWGENRCMTALFESAKAAGLELLG